jgi:hypothetical protein
MSAVAGCSTPCARSVRARAPTAINVTWLLQFGSALHASVPTWSYLVLAYRLSYHALPALATTSRPPLRGIVFALTAL